LISRAVPSVCDSSVNAAICHRAVDVHRDEFDLRGAFLKWEEIFRRRPPWKRRRIV
jgi:hypothetical protein